MAAVTMDGRKLLLFRIVQGKTERSGWGLDLDLQEPYASTHCHSGWMTMPAMLERPWFLRNLPKPQYGRHIHLILDGYATHRCDDVVALAAELGFVLHFIPPGLTALPQPLDRSVLGALKGENRAICRYEILQREDKRMTKADFPCVLDPGMGPSVGSGDAPRLRVLRL